MAMQLRYNAAGVPYLVGGSGVTVGPAPFPNPSVLNQAAQNRAGIARITPKLTAAAPIPPQKLFATIDAMPMRRAGQR